MKKQIARVLQRQAKRYVRKNNPKIVVITGSVGKTTTTQAIATILEQSFNVRKTIANYNSDLGVPCSIFDRKLPTRLKNPLAWLWMMVKNEAVMFQKAPFDTMVLELGTDCPGEIAQFEWLKPDIAVVTAVAPEHMEYFKTIEVVAEEELSAAAYSSKTIINKNMVDAKFLQFAKTEELYNYSRSDIEHLDLKPSDLQVVGEHGLDSVAAGLAVGRDLGMQKSNLINGAKMVKPINGRMRILDGVKGSVLIDDTYNSSPEAVYAALDYLYNLNNKQKIVLLGNMNELGETSAEEHRAIGAYCDPKELDLVVTLGPDANNYSSTAAQDKGCAVAEANSPYEAADIIKRQLKDGAAVLLKGSQNRVFAEEATKLLLKNPEDVKLIVRQSDFWLKIKRDCFKDID